MVTVTLPLTVNELSIPPVARMLALELMPASVARPVDVIEPNNPTTATNETELKDSDNDGYDDYTEFKYGTSPYDPKLFPAIRQGNNKKIFK